MSSVSCELLTPPGIGAIAVLRVGGDAVLPMLARHLRTRAGALWERPAEGQVQLLRFMDDHEWIDDVIVSPAPGERPFASESEAYEICCHGGPRVVQRLIMSLVNDGAILQTHRILQSHCAAAEADTADVESLLAAFALQCTTRATTRRGLRVLLAQRLLLPPALAGLLRSAAKGDAPALPALRDMLDWSRGAHLLWQGATVVLCGAPNTGKSSIANRLAGRESVVVTDRAGTTRDWVQLDTAFDGVPIHLVDTAGEHDAEDHLERRAIEVGRAQRRRADVLIDVIDAGEPAAESLRLRSADPDSVRRLWVLNKIDQPVHPSITAWANRGACLRVSALTGAGIAELREAVLECLSLPKAETAVPLVFDERLREALVEQTRVRVVDGPARGDRVPGDQDWAETVRRVITGRSRAGI